MRIRQIKNLLHDATNIGVGSLFLVHANLIPEDKACTAVDEWVRALHELTHEQLYVYQLERGKPKLFPIHFESIAGTSKCEIHYGPDVHLHRLRFYSRHLKPRFIRGKWLIADFDTPSFWKDNDYRHRRVHERAENRKRESRDTYWQTWSTGQTWQVADDDFRQQSAHAKQSNRASNSPIRNYLERCYNTLGVRSDSSRDEVKSAFRKLAIEFHPDTSSLPTDEAELRFKALTEAYDYIKTANDWS